VADVVARWRERLGDAALVLARREAIEAGWFGAVSPVVEPRIGDVLVACLDPVAIVSAQRFPLEVDLVGLHGSLTRTEMVVPLLVDAG
jgi:hypothetical protein